VPILVRHVCSGQQVSKAKSSPEPQIPWGGADLRFLSPQPDSSLHCETKGASVSCGVPVYSPAFAGTHCAYPRRDGQAVLTWVAGYIPRWFTRRQTVTHPSTSRARRRVTSLITTNTLTTTPSRRHLCGTSRYCRIDTAIE